MSSITLQTFNSMKIAIIGAGNMGGAIAKGLVNSKAVLPQNLSVSDKSLEILDSIKSFSNKIKVTQSNSKAIKSAEIVILAVKPWITEQVITEIKESFNEEKQILISVVAGVNFADFDSLFGRSVSMFRLIPNTAIEFNESVNTITSQNATDKQIKKVENIFSQTGKCFFVQEEELNAYMALSSCGIAYAFRYIRASMQGATEIGVKPKIAQQVVMQTLKGAVTLLENKQTNPEVEIDRVTTPKGITIKGLNEMEANGFTNAVIQGLKKSHLK